MSTAGCLCREARAESGRTGAIRYGEKLGALRTRQLYDLFAPVLSRALRVVCRFLRSVPRHNVHTGLRILSEANHTQRLRTGADSHYSEQRHRRAEFFALPNVGIAGIALSPLRLVVSPPPLRLPGRRFLLRSRLWRWGCFNNGGIQEFAGTVHHRCKIEFAIRVCDIYRGRTDNLQPGIRKPFCRFIGRQRDFTQFCRRNPKSFRQVWFQGIDIIIKKPDHFHSGS